ncbi:MAG: 2-C-methyl-D-erythritol 2,4-cyclodiphosphate synthase [Candidatus Nanopelagicales bacterium]
MIRIGTGVDVHAFGHSRTLWVGCIEWPDQHGLVGHSDGDVAAHAVCDAIFAAAGMGDVGEVFGVDRPEWRNASGASMLQEARRLITEAGWSIENVSVQVVGRRPQVSRRRDEMQAAMSVALGGAAVSAAGTTTDGLGFTGRGEGVAAIATALLSRP